MNFKNKLLGVAPYAIILLTIILVIYRTITYFGWQTVREFSFIGMFGEKPNMAPPLFDIIVPIATAAFAFTGLFLLNRRTKAVQAQIEINHKQLIATEVQNQHEKFITAIEMMDETKKPYQWYIGINLMTAIAQNNPDEFHETTIRALTQIGKAFSNKLKDYNFAKSENSNQQDMQEQTEFVHTVLYRISMINTQCNRTSFSDNQLIRIDDFIIKTSPTYEENGNYEINDMCFENLVFRNCNFSSVYFKNCNFHKAQFDAKTQINLGYCLLSKENFMSKDIIGNKSINVKNCYIWNRNQNTLNQADIGHIYGRSRANQIETLSFLNYSNWKYTPLPRLIPDKVKNA